jgi:hypothetical protein
MWQFSADFMHAVEAAAIRIVKFSDRKRIAAAKAA